MSEKMKEAFNINGFTIKEEGNKIFVFYQFGKFMQVVARLDKEHKTIILTDYYSDLPENKRAILVYLINKRNDTIKYEAVVNF